MPSHPLRGKLISSGAASRQLLSNEEIRTLITAIGAGSAGATALGDFQRIDKARYHKIPSSWPMRTSMAPHPHPAADLSLPCKSDEGLIEAQLRATSLSPLYKIKRKRRERYVDSDEQLNRSLLELGSGDVTLTPRLRDNRTFRLGPDRSHY